MKQSPKYLFREMTPDEAPCIFRMVRERIAWMDRKGIRSWNVTGYLDIYPLEYYEDRAQNGQLFALVRSADGEIVCAGVLLREDKRWPDSCPALYIHHLAASLDERGAGASFLSCAEDYARAQGLNRLRLDCYEDNAEINAYYKAQGYLFAGRCVDGAYRGNLMEKILL